jgi:myosin heavy subunit
VDDRKDCLNLESAFTELGITDPMAYYKTVAAILHISNVEIVDVSDRATIDSSNNTNKPIEIASELLNVSLFHAMILFMQLSIQC